MSINVRQFPIRPAYEFASQKGLAAETAEVRAIPPIGGFRYTTGVRRAHMIELLKENGLLDEFIESYWPEGHTAAGQSKIDLYRRRREAYEAQLVDDEDDDEDEDSSSYFAYERDLQNFLARNLELIEPGLELYSDKRGNGVEYPIDGGRIDLLAKSKEQMLVVIELKLSRGRSKAIGQLLYYMGWVDENLESTKPCRGILIAKDIGIDVVTTVRRTKGVELFRYNLQVALERVSDLK